MFPVAEFIVSDWGDKINPGIGFSYRPARIHRMAGRYDNPVPELIRSPSQRLWLWPLTWATLGSAGIQKLQILTEKVELMKEYDKVFSWESALMRRYPVLVPAGACSASQTLLHGPVPCEYLCWSRELRRSDHRWAVSSEQDELRSNLPLVELLHQ